MSFLTLAMSEGWQNQIGKLQMLMLHWKKNFLNFKKEQCTDFIDLYRQQIAT